jgi:hypothetical protein
MANTSPCGERCLITSNACLWWRAIAATASANYGSSSGIKSIWGPGEIRIERHQAKGQRPRTLPIYGDMQEWLEWQYERRTPGCTLVFHWQGKPIGSHVKVAEGL